MEAHQDREPSFAPAVRRARWSSSNVWPRATWSSSRAPTSPSASASWELMTLRSTWCMGRARAGGQSRAAPASPALAGIEHPFSFNFGQLHAGDWTSSVPEVCTLDVHFSCYPEEDLGEVQRRVNERVAEAARTHGMAAGAGA